MYSLILIYISHHLHTYRCNLMPLFKYVLDDSGINAAIRSIELVKEGWNYVSFVFEYY